MTQKKEKILDAATKLLLAKGIKKPTMDEMAAASKASKVTLYKYFGDKDSLLDEAGIHLCNIQKKQLEDAVSPKDDLVGNMHRFLDVVCGFIDGGRASLCRNLAERSPGEEQVGRVAEVLQRYEQSCTDILHRLIEESMAAGIIKKNHTEELVFHYIKMGLVYYEQNPDYRRLLKTRPSFQKEWMTFYMDNIFIKEQDEQTT